MTNPGAHGAQNQAIEQTTSLTRRRPRIGVFDSGMGGLTVLKALIPRIAGADYTYLGDTARLPYGSKSKATIERYAVSSARFLLSAGADVLVIACNTASALALNAIRDISPVPVLGVIEPGAEQAAANSLTGDVAVIATAATVQSHAYAAACRKRGLRALEKACPLLVPLVEEGWIDHDVTAQVVRIYLEELAEEADEAGLKPDTLLLGCTHYPLLHALIKRTVSGDVKVIDSAHAMAVKVLTAVDGEAPKPRPRLMTQGVATGQEGMLTPENSDTEDDVTCRFFATDSIDKFRRLGSMFLGQPVDEVALVDLGG